MERFCGKTHSSLFLVKKSQRFNKMKIPKFNKLVHQQQFQMYLNPKIKIRKQK